MFAQYENVGATFILNIEVEQIFSDTRGYDFAPYIIDEVPTREYYKAFVLRILKMLLTGTDEG
jgi:hypothetical protein